MQVEVFLTLPFLLIYHFLGIFLLTLFALPRVRENSLKFGYYDEPKMRSSHSVIVPTFGGVAFYVSLILCLFIAKEYDTNDSSITLIVAMTIIFFTGLKDDMHNLSAKKKFVGQIIAVGLLMLEPDFRINSLHGLMGIGEIHPAFSIPLSMFVVLGLINAYNLIDGIDGLASIVGIIIAGFFGFLFHKMNMVLYLFICVTIVGTLLAFLRYNLSAKKKIFMGDTGSLLIGLVLGFLMLKLLSLGQASFQTLAVERKQVPLLLISILFIPIFDLLRVISIRFLRKRPIFSPDRNHMHHILVDSGLSHIKASIICGILNISIALLVFYSVRELNIVFTYIGMIVYTLLLLLLFFIINKAYGVRRKKVKVRNFLFYITSFFFSEKKA